MKTMGNVITVIAMAASILILDGCGPPGPSSDELRSKIDAADKRAQQQAERAGFWRLMTVVTGTGALALLLIGAGLGSKARHESERMRQNGK